MRPESKAGVHSLEVFAHGMGNTSFAALSFEIALTK
jgi:hypothetical protein